jgi:hypothetical protein
VRIEDLAEGEAEIARSLFGAKPRSDDGEGPRYAGWRERYGVEGDAAAAAHALPPARRAFGSSPPTQEAPSRGKSEHGTEIIPRGTLEAAWGQRPPPDAEGHAPGAAPEGPPRRGWTGRFDRPPMADAPAAAGAHAGPVAAAMNLEQTARTRAALSAGAGGAAAAPATAAAGVAGPGGAPMWRDAGAPKSVPPASGGPASSRNGVASERGARTPMSEVSGSEDIEVTIERPPSSGKTWLLVAIGVVCVAAVAAFFSTQTDPDAPTPAPSAAPGATGGALGAPGGATTTAAPPAAGQKPTAPGRTAAPTSGSGKPLPASTKAPPKKKEKCSVFGDTLCPKK